MTQAVQDFAHTTFRTTSGGLDRSLPPMMLYEKAKKYGIWNPSDLDFTQDKKDWDALAPDQRDFLLRVVSQFVSGEEAVTLDLLPLINVIAQEGRLEEEMYLTTFLWEEGKHVDMFNRFLIEVCDNPTDLSHYASDSYSGIISDTLPSALHALKADPSPESLARASAVYNMVVEGMLAETGYFGFFAVMDRHGILPGLREGITKLKLDESRHIAYGVYLLSRLMSEHPEVWETVESTMNELLMPGLGVVDDLFTHYDPLPFDITQEEFSAYAASQFQKRLERVRKARGMSLDEVVTATESYIEADDA